MISIVCPVCGIPNTKAVGFITLKDGGHYWLRTRRWDTCHCVLTPVQDAQVIKEAKREEFGAESAST